MNIVQLHERIRFWSDRVATARFEPSDLDRSLNIALGDIIEEKYAGSKLLPKDSFQRTQKIRDELSNIVKTSNPAMSLSTGKITILKASLPNDYKYLLAIAMYDSTSVRHNCVPQTYDRENVTIPNPYRRVRTGPFAKVYYNELSTGIIITHAFTANPSLVTIYYLAEPISFYYGVEYITGHDFTEADVVIAVSDEVVYNGITYYVGDAITIVAGHLQVTSGTVVFGYTLSDINTTLHETIARRAAINCLITIGEQAKTTELVKFFD
jgi:hypothetical protein